MSYKLYYFDMRGRAEIVRMVFAAAGVPFEDIRFSREEWLAKYKAKSPTGVAPFLEDPVTGTTLVQSMAIAGVIARRFGLMSNDLFELYLIDRMIQQLKDVEEAFVPILFGPEDQREFVKKDFLQNKGPYQFATIVKFLKETNSKFVVGTTLTLADLDLINVLDFVKLIGPEVQALLANYPELDGHRIHTLESNKLLAKYLENRKPNSF